MSAWPLLNAFRRTNKGNLRRPLDAIPAGLCREMGYPGKGSKDQKEVQPYKMSEISIAQRIGEKPTRRESNGTEARHDTNFLLPNARKTAPRVLQPSSIQGNNSRTTM